MENKKINIGIVAAEFNYDITYAMVELAKEHAKFLNACVVEVMKVPGTYDIPLGVKFLLSRDEIDCVVTLGAVIEGQTEHDAIIAQQASRKIIDLSLEFNKPVALGISGPGMSRLEAHERVDYAKRAVEAAIKMCAIKFASEEVKEKEITNKEAEKRIDELTIVEVPVNKLKKKRRKVGRPIKKERLIKAKSEGKVKEGKGKQKIIGNVEKEKIIEVIKNKGKITTKDVMRMFNVCKSTAYVAIKDLLKEGKIKKSERNMEGAWFVIPR